MVGIYLSGTGNTRHCIELLMSLVSPGSEAIPIEDPEAIPIIRENDEIYLAYPTQFSNMPFMVRDFINKHNNIWSGKKVFLLTTMGLFSGDGTGCAARLLKKYGADILGGLQVIMPDSISDCKLLKKPVEECSRIVRDANKRIAGVALSISSGRYPQEGLGFFAHMAGLFGQRLWFYNKTTGYRKKIKVSDACIGCGQCVKNCPMNNLSIADGKALSAGKCAMCYRCVSICPKQAITVLGDKVYAQCRFDKYV
ncbi:MAG: EFR1 family ferrodoxin [Saccharofermentans sp.]|nr:EFR1 family ferrodoxin [Saccharofermentans sp.]